MNFKTIFHVLSVLLVLIAAFMFFPAGVALWYGEMECLRYFVLVPVVASIPGALVFFLTRSRHQAELTPRDGFLLVSLGWITASAVGAVPFVLTGAIPHYTDAFFETMSGFTTTGASILTSIESLPKSVLFWRSLTHWLGGMGIVVLTVAIFPLLGIGGLQLLRAEAPGPSVDKVTPKITHTAKILWLIYLGLTVAETLLLMIGGMTLYDALTHTFGTMATGGFSPKNTSVGFYNSPYLHWVITIFMVMAGMNFTLFFKMITRRFADVFRDSELKFYLAIFIGASLVTALSLRGEVYNSFGTSLQYGAFQVASMLTTTGYATADFAAWPALAQGMLFLMMFIGGCSGSTGGGMKVVRLATLVKLGIKEMKQLIHPRGVFHVRMNKEPLSQKAISNITGLVILYITVLLVISSIVAAAGYDLLTAFTTSLATVGNIGPGFAMVGPAENYAFFQPWLKWILSLAMMMGRLEIYTVLIIFTPVFWKK